MIRSTLFRHKLLLVLVWFSINQSFSQCLEEGPVLIPESSISKNNSYSRVMAGNGDYLAISAAHNDSLEFDGGLVYLYKIISERWEKVAELTASEYNLQMYFGRSIAITDNLIVIAGNTFTDEGYHYDELFVYSKDETEDWVNASESYRTILRDDLNNTGLIVDEMVIKNTVLGVSYHTASDSYIAFYQINSDNSLIYLNTIHGPKDDNNNTGAFGRDFDFSASVVAVGAPYFYEETTRRRGATFVYNFDDAINMENPEPTAILIPEVIDQQDFGNEVEVVGNTVYAANGYSYETGEFKASVYIFEEPSSGWMGELNESADLSLLPTDSWFGYDHTMKVRGDYVFFCRQREHIVYGFKKKSTNWQDANADFSISKAKEFEEDTRVFGNEFVLFDEYLVSSYMGGGPVGHEVAISYSATGGVYEDISSEHQQLIEIHYSASENDFGRSLSYSHNRLAVGANGDRVNGRNAGAVYIYDRNATTEDYDLSRIIRAHDGRPYDNFGSAVEITDSLLFISSLYYDSLDSDGSSIYGSIGKVYQYELEGGEWIFKNAIHNPANLNEDGTSHFGRSISYSDGYVAISQYDHGSSENNGKVFIFKQLGDDWVNTAELATADQQGGDFFGREIVLKDSLLVVATGNPEYGYTDEMRVYLFKRNGKNWESGTEDAYLIPSGKERYDYFGFSIDMHRDLILVGSPAYNFGNTKRFAGRAYLFKKPSRGWDGRIEESLVLEPSEPLEEDFFGYDVSIDDNQILIGAASSINNPASIWHSSGIDDLQPGKLYFFDPYLNDGVPLKHERYIQLSPNNRYLDGFGFKLEKSYDRVFVSAIYDNNESGFRAGGVYDLKYTTYIYGIEDPVCAEEEPFMMQSNILGGVWSGDGIIDSSTGMFDPKRVSADGWTVVTYTAGDCTVSTSVYVGTRTQLIDKSDASITKCKTDTADLFVEFTGNARTVWYYKKLDTDQFKQIESDLNRIEAQNAGYYFVTIDNGICDGLSAQFEVINENVNATLNHSESVEICSYEPQNLFLISDSDLQNINWYYSNTINGAYNLLSASSEIYPDQTGYYFAYYETSLCTYNTDTLSVNYVHQEITLNSAPPLCHGDEFQLVASPEIGLWSGYGVSPTGLIETIGLDHRSYEATYSVIEGNCLFQESSSFDVIKLENPSIETSANEVCVNDPVTLFSANFDANAEITWFLNNKEIAFDNNQEIMTDRPGTYYYKVNLNGCETTSDSVHIMMKTDSLFVPNIVTKNNDGMNEDFRIYHSGASKIKLNIYNRWGDLVYADEDAHLIWQPKVPTGIYYWYLEYANCSNQKQSARGWVNVLSN